MAWVLTAFLATIILGYVFIQIKYRKFYKALREFPGPMALPLLGNIPQIFTHKFDLIYILSELRRRYGVTTCIWVGTSPYIITSKPEDAEVILSSMKNITKAGIYKYLIPWMGDNTLVCTGAKWRAHRKMLTPTFHFKILDNFQVTFNRNCDILLEKLRKKADRNEVFDAFEPLSLYALDVICETALGSSVNAQINSQSDYVKSVKAVCWGVYCRVLHPWLDPDFVFRLSSVGRIFYKAVDVLHDKTNEVLQSKEMERAKRDEASPHGRDESGTKASKVYLDELLDLMDKGADLTEQAIRDEVNGIMFGGHDTVATSMAFTLYTLATKPDIQEKVFMEQKEIFGDDTHRRTTKQDLHEMKYLERVIKESLRMYPSAPVFLRTATSDIKLPDGKVIPTGCFIAVDVLCMGSNEEAWPNPDVFDPDRFLPEISAKRHPYAYIPFSAGPRNCLGQKFAMLEMKSTISMIVRHFRIIAGRAPSTGRLQLVPEIVIKAKDGLPIRVERRV